ncbi:MAG TPA: hypothetical protein VFU23_08580, partial [Gemmatimonadales bacterium]|nr:hypothetical protein [Gemmatimonadales bacterium]
YLAPRAVFGQWLHTYELTDGLVESVLAALHQNFADYRIFLINGGDMLVVASADGPLRRPDWSVVRFPMVRQDLCRFLPMSDAALDRSLVIDRKGLAPLFARETRANSDFYPVLDLGAERSRFLQQSAVGLANLGNGVVDYLGDPSLRPTGFDTATASVLTPVPGVKAMLLAARVRRAGADSAWTDAPGSSERYLYASWARQSASGLSPANWRGWTADFWSIRKARLGGAAPFDTAFFALAGGYADQAGAPAPVRAAVALGEALARRDLAAGVTSVNLLVQEARFGRFWIPVDDLLDASVRAELAAGRPQRARAAYDLLRPYSTRGEGDIRLALLSAYIDGAADPAP